MEEKPEENIAVGSCRSIESFNITKLYLLFLIY